MKYQILSWIQYPVYKYGNISLMTVLLTVIKKLLKLKCLIVLTYVGFIKEREKEQDNEHEIFR